METTVRTIKMNLPANPSIGLGYVPLTTFWEDFCIANKWGKQAVIDTFNNSLEYAKSNYKILTEFVMVLNHQCWYFYEKKDTEMSKFYAKLFYKMDIYATDTLKGEELEYFYDTTD